jgi:hypothetical protein
MRDLITGSTTWTDNAALRRELSALPARTTLAIALGTGVEAKTFLR